MIEFLFVKKNLWKNDCSCNLQKMNYNFLSLINQHVTKNITHINVFWIVSLSTFSPTKSDCNTVTRVAQLAGLCGVDCCCQYVNTSLKQSRQSPLRRFSKPSRSLELIPRYRPTSLHLAGILLTTISRNWDCDTVSVPAVQTSTLWTNMYTPADRACSPVGGDERVEEDWAVTEAETVVAT